MDKKIITIGGILTLLLVFGAVYLLASSKPSYKESLSVQGTNVQANSQSSDTQSLPKPPDFTLPKYDGSGDVNLVASYSQKPTVIQFWATWCEFCRREFRVTNAIVATQKDQINYIAVNFSKESKEAVSSYIKELELDPTILTFVMDETGAVGRAYGVTGTPVHLFIKKGGEVSLFQVGYMSPQKMKDEIAKIL